MNADEIKFRCSSLGYIMTESRGKSETLSETAKTHCVDVFVSAKYGRNMALTGASSSTLAYCLVNTPEVLINDEKRKLMWKMNVISDTDKNYIEACAEIDRLSIYDDIPIAEKVIEITIERNDEDISRIYRRVVECRNYMNEFLFKLKTVTA